MFIVEPPVTRERSEMPAGGGPADDRTYLGWRDGFLVRAADVATLRRLDLACDALAAWRLDIYLFNALNPHPLLVEFTYSHRLRYLALAYRDRRSVVLALAQRFVDEAFANEFHCA